MSPLGFRLFKRPLLRCGRQHQVARREGAPVNRGPDPVDQHHAGIHAVDKSNEMRIGAVQRENGETRKRHDDRRQQTETGEQLGFNGQSMQTHNFPLMISPNLKKIQIKTAWHAEYPPHRTSGKVGQFDLFYIGLSY